MLVLIRRPRGPLLGALSGTGTGIIHMPSTLLKRPPKRMPVRATCSWITAILLS